MTKYCEFHDAMYAEKGGAWAESACKDPDCVFCSRRPANHPNSCPCLDDEEEVLRLLMEEYRKRMKLKREEAFL